MKLPIAIFLLLGAPVVHAQATDITARVVTSEGAITIALYHDLAPQAVANFIGLATGSRPWIDDETGVVRFNTPFYDGSEFHRIENGRLSQTGLRDGHGPGYNFRDEIDTGLSFTDATAYLVAMADRGPNTCGSEFFIIDGIQGSFIPDGENTIFGAITKGGAVCETINDAETDEDNRPLVPITIQSVTISRGDVGFDENAQGLPVITAPEVGLSITAAGTTLNYPQPTRSLTRCFLSQDMASWDPVERFVADGLPTQSSLNLNSWTAGEPRCFFSTSIIEYGSTGVMPWRMNSRTLTMVASSDAGMDASIEFGFSDPSLGDHYTLSSIYGSSQGSIESYTYEPDGYGADMRVELDTRDTYIFRIGLDEFTANLIEGRSRGVLESWSFTDPDWVPGQPWDPDTWVQLPDSDFTGTFTLTR